LRRLYFLVTIVWLGALGFLFHLTMAGHSHGNTSKAWLALIVVDFMLALVAAVKMFGPDEVMKRLHASADDVDVGHIMDLINDGWVLPVYMVYAGIHFLLHGQAAADADYWGTLYNVLWMLSDVVVIGFGWIMWDAYKRKLARLAGNQTAPRRVA